NWQVRLVPLQERLVGDVRGSLVLLLGAVGLVLLIGCVNVANLLLARAGARQREMAMREALGAARWRLARQLLTESVMLSLAGGAAGLAVLIAMKDALLRLVPDRMPHLNVIAINWTVLLFAFSASIATGVLFGLAPALNLDRLDLTGTLRQSGRGTAGRAQARARRLLVIAEFALSLTLMVAAGLLLRSFRDLVSVRLGYDASTVVTVRTRLPYPNDPTLDRYATPAGETPFLRELLRRARALPGVEEAAIGDSTAIPLNQNRVPEGLFFFTLENGGDGAKANTVQQSTVTPEYFHLLGIPALRGRTFTELDAASGGESPRVAVVNDAFARAYWPGEDAVGRRFRNTRPGSPWITVVGVIGGTRTQSLAAFDAPQVYFDVYQDPSHHLAIFLRGHIDRASIGEAMRREIQALDDRLPVFDAQPLGDTVSASVAERRFSRARVGLFALTALMLAALGIYGVIAYTVSERAREIGIRIALGADARTILQMIFGQGAALTAAGAAAGLACAFVVSHLMTGVLYGVTPTDPPTFAGVAAVLVAVALLACYFPARRAIRVDPLTALRQE
ncbi:MAG TPA: ADOP family duplicated permease, partial [Vicinamibacterales bacterium]|nr:ADOP family duplicated permease [Vicinamibacterales bacterium]